MDLAQLRAAAEADPSLENLRALAAGIAAALRGLHDQAGDAELRGEQAQQWETLEAEHRAVVERVEQEVRAERVRNSRDRWRSMQFGGHVQPFDAGNVRALSPQEARSRALALVGGDDPQTRHLTEHLADEQRAQMTRLIRTNTGDLNGAIIAQRALLTCNEAYLSAFARMLSGPQPVLSPEEARALQAVAEWRAMSIGSDGAGGFAVPVVIDPTIILTAQGHPNDILGLARVEMITNDTWRGLSSAGVTWKFGAETTPITDGAPTLAQPSVPAHMAQGLIPFSIEAGSDIPMFNEQMSTMLDEGYSEIVVDKLTRGSGTNEPTGIETALDANTNVEVALATSGTITASDLNGLWAALPIRYRNPANRDRQAWMTHTGVNGAIQELGEEGGAAFTVNFTADGVTLLKGRRAYENDYLDDLPSGTTAANLVIVGDWRNFVVAQRAGMSVELIPHIFDTTTNFPKGQRALYAWARVGSDSVNDLGFRLLQNNTGS